MIKKLFKKTDVKKNLTISVIGTALAQLIHLGTTPIISRIYDPEQFGNYSLFLSFLGVATAISLCKFDLAIIASEKEEISTFKKIFNLLAIIATSISLIVSVALYLLSVQYWYIFAVLTFTIPLSNKYWMYRSIINKIADFKKLTFGKVYENFSSGIITIALGVFNFKDIGLFLGKIGSLALTAIFYKYSLSKKEFTRKKLPVLDIVKKYQNYPKYSFPAELVAQLNLNTTILIFSYFFSSVEVGLIGLTTRVLSLPANFVSISFYDVFKQKALHDYKENGEFRTIFKKFFFVLTILAISMILVIYFLGPWLFNFIFGAVWSKSGIYAQYLCLFYAIRLVTGPLCFSLEVVNKHHINLMFQVIYLVSGISSIAITHYLTGNDLTCIKVYSITLATLYSIHTLISFIVTKKEA